MPEKTGKNVLVLTRSVQGYSERAMQQKTRRTTCHQYPRMAFPVHCFHLVNCKRRKSDALLLSRDYRPLSKKRAWASVSLEREESSVTSYASVVPPYVSSSDCSYSAVYTAKPGTYH